MIIYAFKYQTSAKEAKIKKYIDVSIWSSCRVILRFDSLNFFTQRFHRTLLRRHSARCGGLSMVLHNYCYLLFNHGRFAKTCNFKTWPVVKLGDFSFILYTLLVIWTKIPISNFKIQCAFFPTLSLTRGRYFIYIFILYILYIYIIQQVYNFWK